MRTSGRAWPKRLSRPALAEPATHLLVEEHNCVLAAREHDVEVAPADGLFGPPAVDHAPFLAHERDPGSIHPRWRAVYMAFDQRRLRLVDPPRWRSRHGSLVGVASELLDGRTGKAGTASSGRRRKRPP